MPNGQFGTRIMGGHDSASPRYIHTELNIINWTTFLPPLVKVNVTQLQSVSSSYINSLLENIKKGSVEQHEKIDILKEADFIFINELKKSNLYNKIWQAYAALLPLKTVGVMGDSRTYEYTCLLRAVTSEDGMTADFFSFNKNFIQKVSNKIINSVKGINRVVYDITSKPPGTIEWE